MSGLKVVGALVGRMPQLISSLPSLEFDQLNGYASVAAGYSVLMQSN